MVLYMKKYIILISIIIGTAAIILGSKVVHHRYTHEKNVVLSWKTGEAITAEDEAEHSAQSTEDLFYDLGLIIGGTVIITLALSSIFTKKR